MESERQLKRIIESSDSDVEMGSQSLQEPFKRFKKASTSDSVDEEMEFEDYELELDTNPFLIETVLKVLFGQMSLGNLRQARLVSSLWNQKAVEELENLSRSRKKKSIKKIKVDQNLNLDKFYSEVVDRQIFTRFRIYTPHQLDTICVNFPDKNVLINFNPTHLSVLNSYMNLNTVNWCEIRPKILPNSCNHLRKLEIRNIFKCQNFLPDVKFQFPNLIKFTFEFDKNEVGENYNKFIESVLENSGNLTWLKIQSFPVNQNFVELLSRSKCYEKITKLHLGEWLIHTNQYSRINLDKISEILRLRDLKVAKFKFIGSDGINAFNYFVQSQRLHLKSLNLNFEFLDTVPELKVTFPKFDHLQNLTLTNSTERWDEILEPFSFPEKFPLVENLCLNEMKFFDKICTEGSTAHHVSALKVHGHRVNPLDFPQIQKWFPNISEFSVESQIFPNYCQEIGWSKSLKYLAIDIHTIEQLHQLKLEHLKGLETLKIVFSYNYFYSWELSTVKILSKKSDSFLKGLDNVLFLDGLKKFHLKFVGFKQGGVQEFSQEVVQKVQNKFSNSNSKIVVEFDL